ncbi:tyrosine-type recombinase/integrase [Alcaligenaceae bacterium]|nr:tyrosine-type recombinase/integrase [Alcaligenaceae bacterium]
MGRIVKKANTKKNHLELRGSVWYVRWDIPKDVKHAFGNKRIMKKALSSDKKDAQAQSYALLHTWKSLALKVRTGEYDPEERIKNKLVAQKTRFQMLEESGTFTALEDFEALRELFEKFDILPAYSFIRDADDFGSLREIIKNKARCEDFEAAFESIYATFSQHENRQFGAYTAIPLQDIVNFVYFKKGKDITRAEGNRYWELFNELVRNIRIAYIFATTDTKLEMHELMSLEASLPVLEHETYRHGVTNSALNSWKSSMVDQYKSKKTISDYFSKLKKFQRYLSDNNLDLDFISVAEFKASVSKMKQTQSSYVGAIRRFWHWAIRNQPAFAQIHQHKPDPTTHQQYPKHGEHTGSSYGTFKTKDAQLLFDSCLTMTKPDLELASLIAYGALTGARLEELGSISKNNTIFEDNKPIAFMIEDSKTQSGIREVPIHQNLQALHEQLIRRKQAEDNIFSPKKTKRGTKLDHLSKRFGRLKRSLNFGNRYVFHSLRKTFVTELYESRVSEPLIQRLVGHKGNNITSSIYLDDFSLARKAEAVNLIDISFNISKLSLLLEGQ